MAGSRSPTVSGVSVPNSGVLPTTLALHGLQKPTLESLCRVDQHAGDQGLLRVAPRRSPRALARFRASRLVAFRLIATSPFHLVYLRASQKGHMRRGWGGSVASLLQEERGVAQGAKETSL